jgi:lysophospholipase L1-like esterase
MPVDSVRVPLNQYRENLMKIREIFTQQKVPVIFLTAPTALYRIPIPRQLIKLNFARNENTVRTLHRQYNDVVREIACGEGVYLLDLEKEFDSIQNYSDVFLSDGIHFTEFGNALLGRRISDFIGENISLPGRK